MISSATLYTVQAMRIIYSNQTGRETVKNLQIKLNIQKLPLPLLFARDQHWPQSINMVTARIIWFLKTLLDQSRAVADNRKKEVIRRGRGNERQYQSCIKFF